MMAAEGEEREEDGGCAASNRPCCGPAGWLRMIVVDWRYEGGTTAWLSVSEVVALAGGDGRSGKDVGRTAAAAALDWPDKTTAPPLGARVMVTEVWPRLRGEAREELTKRMISRGPGGESWWPDGDKADVWSCRCCCCWPPPPGWKICAEIRCCCCC
jgi:hypothetical protein